MLFKTIVSGHYKVFSRMKDEERTRNIGVVKYIETLASMAGVDIMEWDAKAIFGSGSGNKFIDNKNEINRLFFEEVNRRAVAAPPPADGEVFSEEVRQQLRAAQARHIMAQIASEQSAADSALRYAMDKYRVYEDNMRKAGEHYAVIKRLSGASDTMESDIRTIIGGNFWDFVGVEGGNKIVFVTKGDVNISHRNPAAGIDISLNMGRFKAMFYVDQFNLKVFPHQRNITARGHVHPHINSSGGVCWGSASNAATAALARGQLIEPMNLLATILNSYNSTSPYVAIEHFRDEIGTPEEHQARNEMDDLRDQAQARFAEIDRLPLNLDLRTEPVVPVVPETPAAPAASPAEAEAIPPMQWTEVVTTTTTTANVFMNGGANTITRA